MAAELVRTRAERDAALAVIENAPHGEYCKPWRAKDYPDDPEICKCWKSTVDTSALAARDAETRADAGERIASYIRENSSSVAFQNLADTIGATFGHALTEGGADRG